MNFSTLQNLALYWQRFSKSGGVVCAKKIHFSNDLPINKVTFWYKIYSTCFLHQNVNQFIITSPEIMSFLRKIPPWPQNNSEISQFFYMTLSWSHFLHELYLQITLIQLTLILPQKCLLNFSSPSNFKVLQSHSKFVKILSECQTDLIQVRAEILGVSSGSKLFAYGTMFAIGRIRVKIFCHITFN